MAYLYFANLSSFHLEMHSLISINFFEKWIRIYGDFIRISPDSIIK